MKPHGSILAVGALWILMSGILRGQAPMPAADLGMPLEAAMPPAYGWAAGPIAPQGGCLDGQCGPGGGFYGGSAGCPDCMMRPARSWMRLEYLLWWTEKRFAPPLVTASPAGTDATEAGQLDEPETSILFGGHSLRTGPHSGFGLETGYWLTPRQVVGIGGRYRWIGEDSEDIKASSAGDPILARPFFNVETGAADSLLVAFPGLAEGSVKAEYSTDLQVGDAFLRWLLYVGHGNRIDLVGGYQRAEINDEVNVGHRIRSIDPNGPVQVGTVVRSQDRFRAENTFHGGFVGLLSEGEDGCLVWRLLTKVAFGNMQEQVTIDGFTTTTLPNGPASTDNFGLLALPTNIGVYKADEFVVMPELDLSVRYQMTCRMAVTLGYQFLYWTDTALAGRIIDTSVNPSQIGGALAGEPRPAFQRDDDAFWVQGLSVGAEFRY